MEAIEPILNTIVPAFIMNLPGTTIRAYPDSTGVRMDHSKELIQAGVAAIENKVTMVTRLRSDAALYAPFLKSKKGTRGRPAVKGKRLPALGVLAEQLKKFSSLTSYIN